MSDKMPELLPCPFCGGPPVAEINKHDFADILCDNHGCKMRPVVCDIVDVAITAWNTRPTQPQAVGDDRGEFHNAFWEAFKTLEEPLRKRFSLHTGRTFANTLFDEFLRRKKNANIKD